MESEPYDRIHAWHMNDDASRVAFSARQGEEDFLVLDGNLPQAPAVWLLDYAAATGVPAATFPERPIGLIIGSAPGSVASPSSQWTVP